MYRALTVASGCYHRDRSITYVWCAIVSLVWILFALTLCVCKTRLRPNGKCPDSPRPEGRCRGTRRPDDICLDTLRLEDPRCVRMANALTLLVQKADAVARVVRTTFSLTLCVRKKLR